MLIKNWSGLALVIGNGGIGSAIAKELKDLSSELEVITCCRNIDNHLNWHLDIESDESLKALKEKLYSSNNSLRLVINCTGLLHNSNMEPEKRLSKISIDNLHKSFSINSIAPIILAKTIEEFIDKDKWFDFASISARVGSIEDNKTGGWYSYRASKAAQNQLFKSLSIEWKRKFPQAAVTLLHPGTTDTKLSKPYQKFVDPKKLFSATKSAKYIIKNLKEQPPNKSGCFIAWDGSLIPW